MQAIRALTGPLLAEARRTDGERHAPGLPQRLREQDLPTAIAALQQGSLDAFEAVLRFYEGDVLRLATRMLGDPDAARDCAQHVFLRLHQAHRRLDPQRPLWPYLRTITANACRDTWRRARLAEVPLESTSDPEKGFIAEPADPTADPERRYQSIERKTLLESALRQLPAGERMALVLRDVEGLNSREVAQALGTSPTTVRSQISRGRVRLQALLQRLERGSRKHELTPTTGEPR